MPCDTSRRHGRQDFLEKFGATFRLEYDKYFDGTEMEALDPEAFAGASGKAVLPVKAVTTGNATELLPESLEKTFREQFQSSEGSIETPYGFPYHPYLPLQFPFFFFLFTPAQLVQTFFPDFGFRLVIIFPQYGKDVFALLRRQSFEFVKILALFLKDIYRVKRIDKRVYRRFLKSSAVSNCRQ